MKNLLLLLFAFLTFSCSPRLPEGFREHTSNDSLEDIDACEQKALIAYSCVQEENPESAEMAKSLKEKQSSARWEYQKFVFGELISHKRKLSLPRTWEQRKDLELLVAKADSLKRVADTYLLDLQLLCAYNRLTPKTEK